MIKAEPLADNAVYGVGQVQYAVAGKSGVNFVDAVTLASFRQATTIEETTGAYAQVVRARQRKIDELGEVLALIAKAVGKIDKKTSSSDTIEIDN
ncbi:MAG: hypothetical protein IIZ06_04245, partial [Kiritimatiellae bacterium]|nr:hypothetical protein [Kiritimatiellia bacterium]